jgi:hypothetical protein
LKVVSRPPGFATRLSQPVPLSRTAGLSVLFLYLSCAEANLILLIVHMKTPNVPSRLRGNNNGIS